MTCCCGDRAQPVVCTQKMSGCSWKVRTLHHLSAVVRPSYFSEGRATLSAQSTTTRDDAKEEEEDDVSKC